MARQHYFYNAMRKTIVQFLDMFNDIVIARYNPDTGAITKYVNVPLKFAPKTKQWYWTELRNAEDRRDHVLPMMAVELESVEYAKDRQVNRNHKITAFNDGNDVKRFYTPVPYDYTFSVQIASEYMVDITQIVEQIFPFFTPEAYIRITLPELNIEGEGVDGAAGMQNLDLRVVYESSSKEAPVEIDEANFRVLLWTLTFKVQGYLFTPIQESKAVHKIPINYFLDEESFDARDETARIGEISSQMVQGLTYATAVPDTVDVPIDDDVKSMYAYEHFEKGQLPTYTYSAVNDDVVWVEDDDGAIINDDKNKNIRE